MSGFAAAQADLLPGKGDRDWVAQRRYLRHLNFLPRQQTEVCQALANGIVEVDRGHPATAADLDLVEAHGYYFGWVDGKCVKSGLKHN